MIEMGARLREVFLLNVQFGERFVGPRIPRLDRERGLELLNCFFRLSQMEIAEAQLEVRLRIRRGKLDGTFEFCGSPGKIAEPLLVQTKVDADVDDIGQLLAEAFKHPVGLTQ